MSSSESPYQSMMGDVDLLGGGEHGLAENAGAEVGARCASLSTWFWRAKVFCLSAARSAAKVLPSAVRSKISARKSSVSLAPAGCGGWTPRWPTAV